MLTSPTIFFFFLSIRSLKIDLYTTISMYQFCLQLTDGNNLRVNELSYIEI